MMPHPGGVRMAKLTPLSKGLIAAVVIGAVGTAVYVNRDKWMPGKKEAKQSNVPPVADLPDDPAGKKPPSQPVPTKPGCPNLPEVRFYHSARTAQAGMRRGTGGKQPVDDSLICKNGVSLKLIREDDVDTMHSMMLTSAESLKAGEKNPPRGAHSVAIMGDGSAAFFKGL